MRFLTVLFLIAFATVGITVLTASGAAGKNPTIEKALGNNINNTECFNISEVSGTQVSVFIRKVWNKNRWRRGKPKKSSNIYYYSLRKCNPFRSHIIKRKWNTARSVFYKHYKKMKYWHKITPYKGGGQRWAIPYYIVVCESGAKLNSVAAPSGAYGLLRSTWYQFRSKQARKYRMPYAAPKIEQDRVAHILWKRYGRSPWTCA